MLRRDFITQSLLGALGVATLSRLAAGSAITGTSVANYSERAVRLVAKANVIDMLVTLNQARWVDERPISDVWLSEAGTFTADDANEYFEAGVNVYALGSLLPDYEATLKWFARWNGFIASNSAYFERIDTVEKLRSTHLTDKIGILLTLQGSFHFRKLDDVDYFHSLGQRAGQLCHNQSNHIATAGFDDDDEGLSEFGVEIVERMQQVGVAIDVSHCSDRTTLECLELAKRPILITHAPCRALNPNYSRGKTDEMIVKMARTGGVIGIPVLRVMIRDREPVTIEHFLDHIDHVVRIAGVEHVGIGSDQGLDTEDQWPLEVRKKTLQDAHAKYNVHTNDRYQIGIDGINHSRRVFDMTEGLIRRGYSDADILLILGGNFARALEENWTG